MPRFDVYFYPRMTGRGAERVPTFEAQARDGAILGTIEAPEGSEIRRKSVGWPKRLYLPNRAMPVRDDGLDAEEAVRWAREGNQGMKWEGHDGTDG